MFAWYLVAWCIDYTSSGLVDYRGGRARGGRATVVVDGDLSLVFTMLLLRLRGRRGQRRRRRRAARRVCRITPRHVIVAMRNGAFTVRTTDAEASSPMEAHVTLTVISAVPGVTPCDKSHHT